MNTIHSLPIIHTTDYIVLGGGLKELAACIHLARCHKKVLLLTKKTFLLEDICDRAWSVPIHPDRIKKKAEEVCYRYGIEILYQVTPLDIVRYENYSYLRIGSKAGICGIKCSDIIDGYSNRTSINNNCFYMHILDGAKICQKKLIQDPKLRTEYEISLVPGAYEEHHSLLEIRINGNRNDKSLVLWKEHCLEIFRWLKQNRAGFENAKPGRFAGTMYSSDYNYKREYKKGIEMAKLPEGNHSKPIAYYPSKKEVISIEEEPVAYNAELNLRGYDLIAAPDLSIRSLKHYDVVVVGGGTAGAMAALHAARNGLKTILLEMNHELGGTSTVGGVSTYWFGNRYRDVEEIDQRLDEIYQYYSIERKTGIWSKYDDWNPGMKSMLLEKLCLNAGVTIEYDAISCAVLRKKKYGRVTGVIAATEEGLCCYKGSYIVDATGDGDIASFAGAKSFYGSERDYATYWASLAQYPSPANYKNNFSSSLIVSDPFDYTRFIRIARLRGNTMYDHGTYVSPRESRHIQGKQVINLKDIVTYRTYEDGIYTCFSNYDPKGKVNADLVYAGVLPPQIEIQIPLRALLPVGENGEIMGGIVIAGKAISCTHNAFPSIRMQPDLMHQGTVIGILLSEAIKNRKDLLALNMGNLRRLIIETTGDPLTLPNHSMSLKEAVWCASYHDRTQWVDLEFTKKVTTPERSLQIMTADSEKIVPLLRKRFADCLNKEETLNVRRLAKYLLWHGDALGVKIMIQSILHELKSTKGLPERKGCTTCTQLLPDHGVMPEMVYELNLLAWSSNQEIMEPFALILDRLKNGARDYVDIRKGIYHYIEAFPYVAERTGNKEFIPMLITLSKFEEFEEVLQNYSCHSLLTERLQYLLLSIYRAMARCAAAEGYQGLIQMLSIDSLPVSASACKELITLTGENYGLCTQHWMQWLKNNSCCLLPKLIKEKIW